MKLVLYENILIYKGKFYVDKKYIKTASLNDRIYKPFRPMDIDTINLNDSVDTFDRFDKIVLLIDSFHWNPAHCMWNFIYPSWYGLYHYFNTDCNSINYQWLAMNNINDKHMYTHKNLIQQISGSKLENVNSFTKHFNKPIMIKYLITGLEGIGIGHVNKNNLTVSRGLEINNIDPIETFINRIYFKYNIKRNSLVDKLNINECKNIIFIKNKRPYNGIEQIFNILNNKYKGNYNFKIIDYSKHTFEEQLHILNTTCICVVGVGSARFNSPFLPNGAIEIQIFQPNIKRKNCIEYLDYHGGTLSKYVKVKNIPYYTKEEATNNNCSYLLEQYIEESINEIPCKVPINLEDNIPLEITKLKHHNNYDKKFDVWRNSMSNRIDDLFNILN